MAYSDPTAKSDGNILTITDYNILRNNWLASALAAYAAKGDLFPASAANTGALLTVGADDSTLVPDSSQTTGLAWQIQPACRVYNDANIDPAIASWHTLTFNSETGDTDAMHSTSTNTSRITVPAGGGGWYHVGGNVKTASYSQTGGVAFAVRVLLNGTTVIGEQYHYCESSDSAELLLNVGCDYPLSAADYVELQVIVSKDIDIVADGVLSPSFWAHWIRRV